MIGLGFVARAIGPSGLTTRVFYSNLLLQRSAMYTRCIDSNLESGRYISRVGRASSFLSLERPPVYLPDGTVA